MDDLDLIGRKKNLLKEDMVNKDSFLKEEVQKSSFLVIGGAGTIGQAVSKEIFSRNPKKLHIVDISENNLVELVRDIRSSFGYIDGDFKTFSIDCASIQFEVLFENEGPYDYVLNLSAMKHVRSEKDPYTLMRMIDVNILNTIKTLQLSIKNGVKKYFCVSTDKAANPVNMMGASKRIMEMFLFKYGKKINISTARFANVAFSDGSLLYGFNKRLDKNQPISAPNDVRRYFVISKEAGELCLLSAILGNNGDIFFPKLSSELNLITFSSIAEKYLRKKGLEPFHCESEDEARSYFKDRKDATHWPCYFFKSDTTGEKDFEEFFTDTENVDMERFKSLGVVSNNQDKDESLLDIFLEKIDYYKSNGWTRLEIIQQFQLLLPNFMHKETGKFLEGRM